MVGRIFALITFVTSTKVKKKIFLTASAEYKLLSHFKHMGLSHHYKIIQYREEIEAYTKSRKVNCNCGGKRNKAEIVGKSPDNGEGRLKDLWNNSTPFWRREMG